MTFRFLPDDLQRKLDIIERLKPHDINDFVPLTRVSIKLLLRAQKIMRREAKEISDGNRIYYLSNRLEVEPWLVSKYFSTHMFMFNISFDKIVENLGVMLEFGITPLSILRDLWAFENSVVNIRTRLVRCQRAGTLKLK